MVSIRLCGVVEVRAGRPLTLKLGRKLKEVVAFLAIRPGIPQRREKIAEALWPERSEAGTRSALNTGLWRLKSQLETMGLAESIRLWKADDGAIALVLSSDVEVDCLTLQQVVEAAAEQLMNHGALPDNLRDRLRTAIELYHGPFLEGYESEWLLPERERFHCVYIRGLSVLMHAFARIGRHEDAIDWGRRILSEDPLREAVQRELMWLHLMNGQRSEAIAQYLRLAGLLRDELGIEPMAETTALYEHILAENRADFAGADHGAGTSSLTGLLAFIDGCTRRRAGVFDALAQADSQAH